MGCGRGRCCENGVESIAPGEDVRLEWKIPVAARREKIGEICVREAEEESSQTGYPR